jgi:hypothetical protein
MFKNHPEVPVTYILRLYIPSPWEPSWMLNRDDVESALVSMETLLLKKSIQLPRYCQYNLSHPQRQCLQELANRNDLIIYPADKNLGPCVVEREQYIKQVFSKHLNNRENYKMISLDMIDDELLQQRKNFLAIYDKFHTEIHTSAEKTYFSCALNDTTLGTYRVLQFYCTYKVHKTGQPKMRPIVSCVNSLPEIFSKWIDYWLKKVVATLVPTYIKDSADLIKSLHKAFPNGLPTRAKLFSADAVSMYSNIDTHHSINVIDTFLTLNKQYLPPHFPNNY